MKQSYLKSASKYVFIYLLFQVFITTLCAQTGTSQQGAYFRSKQSGNWNNISTWEASYDNINWANSTVSPTFSANNIAVQAGHDVSITASETIDQVLVYGKLTYADVTGSTLTINNGEGIDLEIYGTFEELGPNKIIWNSGATWIIQETQSTLIQIKGNTLDWLLHHYNQDFPFGNWILRKTGNGGPLLSPGNYPNIIIENNTTSTWITDPLSTFIANEGFLARSLDVGGNGTGDVSFLINENCYSSFFLDYDLTVKEGSTIRNYGTGIELKGNLFINGEIDYGSSDAGVTLISANEFDRSISSSTSVTLKNLSLKNLELDVNPKVPNVTLNCPLTITGTFTFTTGYLITDNTNILTFGENAIAEGASDNSFVSGPVQKIGNTAFTFPVGKEGHYQPIGISAPGDINSIFKAEYFIGDHGLGQNSELTLENITTCEYWKLERTYGSDVEVKSEFNYAVCNNFSNNTNLKFVYWDGFKWLDIGSEFTNGILKTNMQVTNFGFYTIGEREKTNPCAASYLQEINDADPQAKERFDLARQQLWEAINHPVKAKDAITFSEVLTIPVVFHLLGSNSTTITDEMVQEQLDLLNNAFANNLGSTSEVSNKVQVRFCLAQNLPNGADWSNLSAYKATLSQTGIAGITRCTSCTTIADNHTTDPAATNGQSTLTQAVYFSSEKYLNIWVVNNITNPVNGLNEVLGYSPYPILNGTSQGQFLDGVVMRSDAFGINSSNARYNKGYTLIHEVGHYLFLYHPFQFGCYEVENQLPCNALGSGDECCDTPPVFQPNQNNCKETSSCSEVPNLDDQIQNYMDYAYDIGGCKNTFTADQAIRMRKAIELFRTNLVLFPNLVFTGADCGEGFPVSPVFVVDQPNNSRQLCIGQSYNFKPVPGASSYFWTFENADITTSTLEVPSVLFNSIGIHTVSLTVSDPNNVSTSYSLTVFVSECNPIQSINGNWHFGYGCGLTFANGYPEPVASNMHSIETNASISNESGELLFYTDGGTIYDRTHNIMNNSTFDQIEGSANDEGSASQGVAIVQKPGNSGLYYIFTVSDIPTSTAFNHGLGYSIVDMNSGSNGSLTSVVNQHPLENYNTTEHILVVPHCNGTDYWVIVKPVRKDLSGLLNPGPLSNDELKDKILAYRLTSAGLSDVPVVSKGDFIVQTLGGGIQGNNGIGISKVSPDRKFIVFSDIDVAKSHIYRFNCETGILNYITDFAFDGLGVSFSPNSKVLYLGGNKDKKIVQLDLSNFDECNPTPPYKRIQYYSQPNNNKYNAGFQLGPDGKLYLIKGGFESGIVSNELAVINFPNEINSTDNSNECGFNFEGVFLNPDQKVISQLPNISDGLKNTIPIDFSYCLTNCFEARFSNLSCGTTYTWNFGDGSVISGVNGIIPSGTDGGKTSGNFEYPVHIYASTGEYNVTLTVNGGQSVTHKVTITIPQPPDIAGPNPVCITNTEGNEYYGPADHNYLWTVTNGLPLTGNQQTIKVFWTSFPATLNLTVTDPLSGCSNSSSVTINSTADLPLTNAGQDLTICENTSATLNGTGVGAYQWSPPNSGLSCYNCISPLAVPLTTTTYTLNIVNGCGAKSDEVIVNISSDYPVASFSEGANPSCTPVQLTANAGSGYKYQWLKNGIIFSGISTSNIIAVASTGQYSVIVTNAEGCSSTSKSKLITINKPVSSISIIGNPECDPVTLQGISGANYTYQWMRDGNIISGATGFSLTTSIPGSYSLITTLNGCSATSKELDLEFSPPVADFSFNRFNNCENNDVVFVNSSFDWLTASWNFGDGTVENNNAINVIHQFEYPGFYPVTLTVTDVCNRVSTIKKIIQILPSTSLYNPNCGCLNAYGDNNYDYIDLEVSAGTGNIVWPEGSYKRIKGTITIKAGYKLEIQKSIIEFGPHGKIIVEPGGTFISITSNFKPIDYVSVCGGVSYNMMWQGIEVWGNPAVEQTSALQGNIRFFRSHIFNAHNGITLGKWELIENSGKFEYNGHSSGGAIADIGGASSFQGCGVGIRIWEYPKNNISLPLEGIKFNSNGPLPDPYYTHTSDEFNYGKANLKGQNPFYAPANFMGRTPYGVYLTGVRKFIFSNTNIFSNEDTHIYSDNASFKISDAVFNNCRIGIQLNNSITANQFHSILGNTFQNYGTGILVNSCKYSVITDNVFNDEKSSQEENLLGLSTRFSTNLKIQDNIFTRNKIGIQVHSMGTVLSQISYKTNGNTFTDCKSSIITLLNNKGLQIRCNNFNKPTLAIPFENSWAVSGSLLNQGFYPSWPFTNNSKAPAGNSFFNSGFKNISLGTLSSIFNYYRHNDELRKPASTGQTSQMLIVNANVSYGANSCPAQLCQDYPCTKQKMMEKKNAIGILKEEKEQIISKLDNGKKEELINLIKESNSVNLLKTSLINNSPLSEGVIDALLDRTPPLPPAILKEILMPNLPASGKIFSRVQEKIASFPIVAVEKIRMAQGDNAPVRTITTVEREIEVLEIERQNYLHHALVHLDENNLEEEAISLIENEPAMEHKQSLVGTYIVRKEFDKAKNMLSQLPGSEADEIAYKEFHNLAIELGEQGKTWFDMNEVQRSVVRNIAAQCPISLASENARAVLKLVFEELVEECPPLLELKKFIHHQESEQELFISPSKFSASEMDAFFLGENLPNPFSETTIIPYKIQENGEIHIMDYTGKVIESHLIKTQDNFLTLKMEKFSNGIYWYSLILNGVVAKTRPMVISR